MTDATQHQPITAGTGTVPNWTGTEHPAMIRQDIIDRDRIKYLTDEVQFLRSVLIKLAIGLADTLRDN